MSQATPRFLLLAGCSHHTGLSHSVQVADLTGSLIHSGCGGWGGGGDLSLDERDGIFSATAQ